MWTWPWRSTVTRWGSEHVQAPSPRSCVCHHRTRELVRAPPSMLTLRKKMGLLIYLWRSCCFIYVLGLACEFLRGSESSIKAILTWNERCTVVSLCCGCITSTYGLMIGCKGDISSLISVPLRMMDSLRELKLLRSPCSSDMSSISSIRDLDGTFIDNAGQSCASIDDARICSVRGLVFHERVFGHKHYVVVGLHSCGRSDRELSCQNCSDDDAPWRDDALLWGVVVVTASLRGV